MHLLRVTHTFVSLGALSAQILTHPLQKKVVQEPCGSVDGSGARGEPGRAKEGDVRDMLLPPDRHQRPPAFSVCVYGSFLLNRMTPEPPHQDYARSCVYGRYRST
jgi:hypothetical protein